MICPVSAEKVNESAVRVAAFITVIITGAAIYCNMPVFMALLAADFYLRAFTGGKYSPVKVLSKKVAAILDFPVKPVDAAPKKFAAGVGLAFSAAISLLVWFQFTVSAYSLAIVLVICASLESFFGYCVGCVAYSCIVTPFLKRKSVTGSV